MNYEEFNQYCASFPATSHVVQWGNSDVWKVGGKVFAIGGLSKANTTTFTFKTSPRNFDFLRDADGYIPAPYFASRGMKWIQQVDDSAQLDDDLRYYIRESFRLVVLGLTKQKRQQLGLTEWLNAKS